MSRLQVQYRLLTAEDQGILPAVSRRAEQRAFRGRDILLIFSLIPIADPSLFHSALLLPDPVMYRVSLSIRLFFLL